jgi:hypothetical protein
MLSASLHHLLIQTHTEELDRQAANRHLVTTEDRPAFPGSAHVHVYQRRNQPTEGKKQNVYARPLL